MKIINSIDEMKQIDKKDFSIGLVPTMGYLHEGHVSLIKRAKKENDIVVTSIFVNSTQFGPNEDFEKYPRNQERDFRVCKSNGCDIVFSPKDNEMYPNDYLTFVEVKKLGKGLCGKSRPTHFRGVTTVLIKLFNIIKPDKVYFGQKDFQQLVIVKKMVEDFNIDIDVIGCPIIREKDGLAISSRNLYLNDEERKDALLLYKSLIVAKGLIQDGERNVSIIKEEMKKAILLGKNNYIDYIEFIDIKKLNTISKIDDKLLIAIAVNIGHTRLIDNIIVEL